MKKNRTTIHENQILVSPDGQTITAVGSQAQGLSPKLVRRLFRGRKSKILLLEPNGEIINSFSNYWLADSVATRRQIIATLFP